MVGVVGSSPIAPTKQNPLCWAVWKGSPKGGPFFVVCDLKSLCKACNQAPIDALRSPALLNVFQTHQIPVQLGSLAPGNGMAGLVPSNVADALTCRFFNRILVETSLDPLATNGSRNVPSLTSASSPFILT
jgi:uncharacterized protein YejL (UPF0352 family)